LVAAALCFWREERRMAFQISSTTMAPPIDPMMPLSCPIQINHSEVPLRTSRMEIEI